AATEVRLKTTHEVMRCGNNGNRLRCYIEAMLITKSMDLWKSIPNVVSGNMPKIEPHTASFGNSSINRARNDIAWREFFNKTFALVIDQVRAFTANGFRDQEWRQTRK